MSDFRITQKSHQQNKIRESGVELLRCLAIFFVVVIHEVPSFLDADQLFVFLGRIIAWPAIFCFSFITGYFLMTQKQSENKIKRFWWLTLEIVIWRVAIAIFSLLIITLVDQQPAIYFAEGLKEIVINLVDVKAWYFWAIIFVYLIFPFFSAYLQHHYLKGKKLIKWIVVFLILTSILATLGSALSYPLGYNFSLYQDQYTVVVVLTSALIGGYWHLIEQDKKIQWHWKWQIYGLLGLISVYLINFSFGWWGNDQGTVLSYLNIFWYLSGFCYFLIFKNFRFHNRFVNWWANLSWWIYLIHNGAYLPRGWATRIIGSIKLDPYSSTILSIFLCYFLAIILTLIIKNLDQFVIKSHILQPIKNSWKQQKQKKSDKQLTT